ncbi:MAG: hypothetical protein GTN76_09680 [Candidatus Aenigmarchaeota archaeon]|nr:hypothetical protein [Candidatus Aenigmarchaeota archaeon]
MGQRQAWIIFIFVALALVQLIFMLLALMELRSSKPAFAQDDDLNRQTLRGIQGVHIVIESLKPEISGDGLAEERLRVKTVKKLQAAGLKVLSETENQMTPGRPYIYVHSSVFKYRYFPLYIYNNKIELVQDAYLVRTINIRAEAVTWSVSATGLAPRLEAIRTSMERLLDYFIEAYLSANPK